MDVQPVPAQPFQFLKLSAEIRNQIYSILLVDEKSCVENPRTVRDHDQIGNVKIREAHPDHYDPAWFRSSHMRWEWMFDTEHALTTYAHEYPDGRRLQLQIFLVCRQLYTEASVIFYTRNRFVALEFETLLPFLKDRSTRARSLIRYVSIPNCRQDEVEAFDDETERHLQEGDIDILIRHREQTWTATFSFLASQRGCLPDLKQLDVRYPFSDVNTLLPDIFDALSPTERELKHLLSVVNPGQITMSHYYWPETHASWSFWWVI
ncbi:hypothetical protein MMC12_001384 [Toensbergia leucococca]|nr:hypothetical protein [Toensbergia leucococca]